MYLVLCIRIPLSVFAVFLVVPFGKVRVGDRERDSITKDEVQSAYDKYKDDLNGRLAKIFVMNHKNDEWFKERYMPGEREITKAKIIEYRRELWVKWKALMDSDAFNDVDREAIGLGAAGDDPEEVNRGAIDDGGLKPVLLIKTISPTVSRIQLEEVSYCNPWVVVARANRNLACGNKPSKFSLCFFVGS